MARKDGKIIKQLDYYPEGHDPIKVPLRLVDNVRSMKFLIDIDEPIPVCVENKDPDVVRKDAFKILDEHFAIKWEDYIRVDVEAGNRPFGDNRQNETCQKIGLTYEFIQIGTKKDGSKCWRNQRNNSLAWARYIHPGDPMEKLQEKDTDRHHYNTGFNKEDTTSMAYIKRTDANIAALQSIISAMRALGERMMRFMDHDTIMKTLANTSALLLPPPPKPKQEIDHGNAKL